MSDQQKDTRTATQRLTDLENAIMSLFHVNDNLARDVMNLKEALKLLDNKVNSIVKATVQGEPLSDAVLNRLMIERNVEELTEKVTTMVGQGLLKSEQQVTENSFVVGSELNDEGEVINPRLQFALRALSPELQSKLVGAQVGDTLLIQEGKLKFRVLESYQISTPSTSNEAPAEEASATEEVAPASNQ